ncbi:MAG: HEAT repeat domain-containing protein [Thermoleophilia bacterium]
MELVGTLYRAYRAVRFYPPDHPVAAQSLEGAFAAISQALSAIPVLRLDVQEDHLTFAGQVVHSARDLRENLAFLMFRDGIRSLIFRAGLDQTELVGLVRSLAQAHDADRAEEDLATILWEQDFAHIQYQVVDPLLEAGEAGGRSLESLRFSLGTRLQQAEQADLSDRLVPDLEPGPAVEATRLTSGALTGWEEIRRLEAAIENEPDVLEEFLVVLSEVLVTARTDREAATVARALSDVLRSYLEWGEFDALVSAIRRLRALAARVPENAALIHGLLRPIATRDRLRKAVFGLDGPHRDQREAVEALLLQLRDWVYPAAVELLVEAGGKLARKCLLNVLTAEPGVPVGLIVPRLGDPRWYVVRNIVYVLGCLQDPAAITHLERTLDNPDERVRRETVRALANIGGPRALYLVTATLGDPDSSVRAVAARAAAGLGGGQAGPHLLKHVTSRDFASRPEAEIDAFFDALGQVADDRAIPALDELWESRSLIRNRPQALRLGALRVLGRIGSPAARASLARAARSGDERLRRQAKKSLLEAENRAAG